MLYRIILVALLCLSIALPAKPMLAMPGDGDAGNTIGTRADSRYPPQQHERMTGCHHRSEGDSAPATGDQDGSSDTAIAIPDCCGHCHCGCISAPVPVAIAPSLAGPLGTRLSSPDTDADIGMSVQPPLRPPIR
jgi:hypothetical protein